MQDAGEADIPGVTVNLTDCAGNVLASDVTERHRLREQLLRSQKLDSLGRLAGGIAHDFNNLLMNIQGNTSLMLFELNNTHPHFELLKNIEKQVKSGAQLTKCGLALYGNV
mgnify:CR=1 FL=1